MMTTARINDEVANYYSLVERIIKGEYSSSLAFVEYDDLLSVGLEGLFIGIKTFNEQVAKEIHSSQNIRLKISKELTRSIERKQKEALAGFSTVSLTTKQGHDWQPRPIPYDTQNYSKLCEEVLNMTSERLANPTDKEILRLMLQEYTQQEIAETIGMSQQAINKRIKRIRTSLKDVI